MNDNHTNDNDEPKGEFIDDWVLDDEPCEQCDGTRVHYRRWRRHSNGEERVLIKCFDCQDSMWVDG